MNNLVIFPLEGKDEITKGFDLARWITDRFILEDGDVVVVSSKVISKLEGCLIHRSEVTVSDFARTLAERTNRDPVYCEIVLRESADIVRMAPGAVICRTRHGFVLANAGVDGSNCPEGFYAVLPKDPDASARHLRDALQTASGKRIAVILSDTFGRAWRIGQTDLAVGVAGLRPVHDYHGNLDRQGRSLRWTCPADADELASAAELVRGKADGVPVVVIRGYIPSGDGFISEIIMPENRDLFR